MRTKNNFNVNYDFCNYMKKVNYISFDKIQFDLEKKSHTLIKIHRKYSKNKYDSCVNKSFLLYAKTL